MKRYLFILFRSQIGIDHRGGPHAGRITIRGLPRAQVPHPAAEGPGTGAREP